MYIDYLKKLSDFPKSTQKNSVVYVEEATASRGLPYTLRKFKILDFLQFACMLYTDRRKHHKSYSLKIKIKARNQQKQNPPPKWLNVLNKKL